MSESQLKDQIAEQLREQKIFNAVTKSVAVSNSDITKYYDQNKKTLYTTPATRHVRHILVKTKALAEKLYSQLRLSDKNFAKDAKKYSQDKPGSAEKGGDLGDIQQGQTVPPFDKVAFDIAPNIVSRPVKTQFGYHLIEALGPVNPSATKPLNTTLKKQIQTQLQQTKKQQALSTWYQNLKKNLDKKVTYAKGYQPPTTATTPTGAGTTT
jgi:parvulin-like peptidyl-prolyl isomerase